MESQIYGEKEFTKEEVTSFFRKSLKEENQYSLNKNAEKVYVKAGFK